MEKSHLISAIFSIILFLGTINAKTKFLMRKPEFENIIIRKYVLQQVDNTATLTICVYRCIQDLRCVSLFYNKDQKSCQINSVLFITPGHGVLEIGTNYYSLFEEGCPVDFIRNRKLELCYKPVIETEPGTLSDARGFCEMDGYVLVRGKTVEDYLHIADQLTASPDYETKKFYVDGSDADVEGVWKFSNGENMTAFLWGDGEPDGDIPEKDFIYLQKQNGLFEMSDIYDFYVGYFICQQL